MFSIAARYHRTSMSKDTDGTKSTDRGLVEKALESHSKAVTDTRGQAGASIVNSLVVIGTALFIGIFVLGMIADSMPLDDEEMMFYGAVESVEGILESSFELAAILPIVLIAGALLYYVRGFGSNGRRQN